MATRWPGSKGLAYYSRVRVPQAGPNHSSNGVKSPQVAEPDEEPHDTARTVLGEIEGTADNEEETRRDGKIRHVIFGYPIAVSARLILLCVPMLWASYSICVKCLYRLPWGISAPTFNCIRLILGAAAVLPAMLNRIRLGKAGKEAFDLKAVVKAGFELGFYTFMVNVLQMFGLRFISASRGAFLSQLSTIMVPVTAFAIGMEPRLRWNICIAAVMALLGVGCLTFDGVSAAFSLQGDGMLLGAACGGTMYVLRSKMHADKGGPLVEMKTLAQAVYALCFMILCNLLSGDGLSLLPANFFAGATPALVFINVLLVVWAGFFVSVLSTYWQIQGQALVSASEAIVFFTFTPLWVTAMAVPLGERFGGRGIFGAGLILASTLLASRGKTETKSA